MLLIIGKVVSIFAIMLVGFVAYKVGVLGDDALPTAVFAAVIAEQYKKNSLLLSEMVSLTTLMSVVTIPLAAIILEVIK